MKKVSGIFLICLPALICFGAMINQAGLLVFLQAMAIFLTLCVPVIVGCYLIQDS